MAATLKLDLPATAPLRLVQLSDCHFLDQPGETMMGVDTAQSFKAVLQALASNPRWPADLILLTGDLVQNPSPTAYQRLLNHLRGLDTPWVCLPGNHDDPDLMTAILCQKAGHCSKRILAGHWQIICLNSQLPGSHAGHLPPEELDLLYRWVTGNLRFTLIALHHPPLPVGSAWMDTMQLDNSGEFFNLLNGHPHIKGVIFGHVHQVFSAHYRHLPLWSAPSTCFQFKPHCEDFALDNLPAGWRWLELHSDGQIHTWVERLDHCPPGLDFTSAGY